MRGTLAAKAVARELLRQPNGTRWSRDISHAIKAYEGIEVWRASVGRILARMEAEEWLYSWRELREDCRTRLPHLYFRITPVGLVKLQEFLGSEQENDKPLTAVGQ